MKKIGVNALLILGSLFVAALIAEAGLRIIGFTYPFYYTYDPDLGSTLRPGAEGLYQKEGKAYVIINSDGLRDIEHTVKKPANTYRIAILGDSYAEGLQVDIKKLFWKVLENKLQGCRITKEQKVEVINFGVSGFGTARELLMLRKKVWKYQPDLVILAFLTGNDISDNSKELNRIDYIPYFNLNEKGELVLDKDYLESESYKRRERLLTKIIYSIGNDVRLLQLLNSVRHAWQQRASKNKKKVRSGEVVPENKLYFPPREEVWKKAWAVTEALLLQLNKEVMEKNTEFLLVTLSSGPQTQPNKPLREEYMKKKKIKPNDLFYPDNRIKDFAQGHDLDVLTLAPLLAEISEKNNIYMHGFSNTKMGAGHWNENGHRYAGELIAQHLCKRKN